MPDFEPTHAVTNQVPPLEGTSLVALDRPLLAGLAREGAGWAEARVRDFGDALASDAMEWAEQANRNPPQLRSHDRRGNRIDQVEYHPAWHQVMTLALAHEVHALAWREPRAGAHVARAALMYALYEVESGSCCPISMTYSCVPALRAQPELAAEWEPRLLSRDYDPRALPASEKRGALCGMAMTEKQGGSDVRANSTRAEPEGAAGPGEVYRLVGHKWFCSAPMSDAFLVLAQTQRGVSCFLMPGWLPDGSRNHFQLQRLKDKLGDRSNASSEIELRGALGRLVGEEGRGVPTIIEMVNHTRLDCVIGSAANMRASFSYALHHARHRSAFGKRLVEHDLMRNVLADLALESQAATATMLRLARAYDEAGEGPEARAFSRIATAVCKYWVCKRAPTATAEALECLGGNGYVEESALPRLYRQSPLNSIWEGSGNVICLDVLRAMGRSPESVEILLAELDAARGGDARLDAYVADLRTALTDLEALERRGRRLVERLALALQGALLVRGGDAAVSDAFCASRLAGDRGLAFGTLPRAADLDAILSGAFAQSG